MKQQECLASLVLYLASYTMTMALAYALDLRLVPLLLAVVIPAAVVFHHYRTRRLPKSKLRWLTLKNSAPSGSLAAVGLLLPFNLSAIMQAF